MKYERHDPWVFGSSDALRKMTYSSDETQKRRVRLEWLKVYAVVAAITGFLFFLGFVLFLPETPSYPLQSAVSLIGLAGGVGAVFFHRSVVRKLAAVDKHLDLLKARRMEAIARQQAAAAAREEQERADRERFAQEKASAFPNSDRKRPEPQPYGVSNEGAEHYVASWFEYLGQFDVSITTFSGDGGIDVLSRDYVCQVKNYRSGPVTVSEVRDLFGTAVSEGRKAVLFTSSSVTQQGIEFADKNQVALVRFLPQEGKLDAINMHGIDFLNDGNYDSE